MEKKILLFLAILIFSFHYCNDKILLYKSDLKEVKVNTRMINKTFENKVYTIKVIVGENFLGKVTSVNLEIVDENCEKIYNSIFANKDRMRETISNFISSIGNPDRLESSINDTTFSIGNCVSRCTKRWDCYNKPTEAGVMLCASDCLIECA